MRWRPEWGRAAVVGVLVALGMGGAAVRPGGFWIGAPGLPVLLGALGLAIGLGLRAWTAPLRGQLGLLLAPTALVAGLPLPGLGALSGPPLLALAFGGAVGLVWSDLVRARRLFFPVVLAVYVAVALGAQRQVGAEGDEPHYLMVAESLLRDGDLALEGDYAEGRYRAFYRTHPDLAPHYRVRGREGEIYSLHAIGLSLLVLPAYAVAGYPGASLFMALLAALLALEVRGLLRSLAGGGETSADATAWVLALSPPLVHYAGLIFTEVPAALLVAVGLRRGRSLGAGWAAAALGAGLAFLPWLNVRYAPVAVLLALYAMAGPPSGSRWRRGALLLAPLLLSAAGVMLYHEALYGFADPRRVYGARPELSLAALPEGLAGLLLDQEFGLLAYAPVFAFGLLGLAPLWRRQRRSLTTATAVAAVLAVTAGSWHMWRGGFNPPARFLVPAVPALAPAVAAGLGAGPTPAGCLLIGWGLWTGATGAAEPRLVHRDRDGTAPLFRTQSGAEEWTGLLPAFVLSEPDRYALAAVWLIALALAVVPRPRAPGAWGYAAAALGLWAACAAAGALSDARTGPRDAARLIGRDALAVPGWRPGVADARFGSGELGWGPLFEPHRHPGGAVLADRLMLDPGRYRLSLRGERFDTLPGLLIRERGGAVGRHTSLAPDAEGVSGEFEVVGTTELSLALSGGGPFLIEGIAIESLPDGGAYNR